MGVIKGNVTTFDDQPIVEAAAMVASGPTHHDVAALTDERGIFQLAELEPGRYVIQINAEGYLSVRRRVTVRAGGTTRVRITLEDEIEPEI